MYFSGIIKCISLSCKHTTHSNFFPLLKRKLNWNEEEEKISTLLVMWLNRNLWWLIVKIKVYHCVLYICWFVLSFVRFCCIKCDCWVNTLFVDLNIVFYSSSSSSCSSFIGTSKSFSSFLFEEFSRMLTRSENFLKNIIYLGAINSMASKENMWEWVNIYWNIV